MTHPKDEIVQTNDYDSRITEILRTFESERKLGYVLDMKEAVQRIKALILEADNAMITLLEAKITALEADLSSVRGNYETDLKWYADKVEKIEAENTALKERLSISDKTDEVNIERAYDAEKKLDAANREIERLKTNRLFPLGEQAGIVSKYKDELFAASIQIGELKGKYVHHLETCNLWHGPGGVPVNINREGHTWSCNCGLDKILSTDYTAKAQLWGRMVEVLEKAGIYANHQDCKNNACSPCDYLKLIGEVLEEVRNLPNSQPHNS